MRQKTQQTHLKMKQQQAATETNAHASKFGLSQETSLLFIHQDNLWQVASGKSLLCADALNFQGAWISRQR